MSSPRDEIDPAPLWIGLLLMIALAVQVAWPQSPPSERVTRRIAAPPSTPSERLTLDYPQVLTRPLFTPARGAAGAIGQAASSALSDYVLAGVARVGNRGEAVFRSAGGDVVTLRLGETLLGWRLSAVEPGAIVLEQGGVTRTMRVGARAASPTGAP